MNTKAQLSRHHRGINETRQTLAITFVGPVPAAQLDPAGLRLQVTPVVRGEVHQRVVGQTLLVQGLQDLTWRRWKQEAAHLSRAPLQPRPVWVALHSLHITV